MGVSWYVYLFMKVGIPKHFIQDKDTAIQNPNPNFISSELKNDSNRFKRNAGRGRKWKQRRRSKVRRGPKKSKSKKQSRSQQRQSIVFSGEDCQFVDFGSVGSSGSGCVDGTKMVLKNA